MSKRVTVLGILISCSSLASGQCLTEPTVITPPAPASQMEFGQSLAINADLLYAGSTRSAGRVDVFDIHTAQWVGSYHPNPSQDSDMFGRELAINSDRLVVGAPLADDWMGNMGAVYVFELGNSEALYRLTQPTPFLGSSFGSSVAMSGELLVVGAEYDDTTGAVYIYDMGGPTLVRKLSPEAGQDHDYFGSAVSTDGEILAVAAMFDSQINYYAGSVTLYNLHTGEMLRKIHPPAEDTGILFGSDIAIHGRSLFVGSAKSTMAGFGQRGAVFRFDLDTGDLLQTYFPDDADRAEGFGTAIDIDDGTLAVGSVGDFDLGNRAGAGYLFDLDSGSQLYKLVSSGLDRGDSFGQELLLASNSLIVGATRADVGTAVSGTVSIFGIPESGCPTDVNGDSKLDFFDLAMFLDQYAQGDSAADYAAPCVSIDYRDVVDFIADFLSGCP